MHVLRTVSNGSFARKAFGLRRRSNFRRNLSKNCYILGIETSCDDTGAAVVSGDGEVLSNIVKSQTLLHLQTGGIIPDVARLEHTNNIHEAVTEAVASANIRFQDLTAIAVTTKPGLAPSLYVGCNFAASLSKELSVEFPFLVLLASGGHCLLAVAKDVSEFFLLGTCVDSAPGDVSDKLQLLQVARELRLKDHPDCSHLCGGAAIELLATTGNPLQFDFCEPLQTRRDCNFSFSGIQMRARRLVKEQLANYPDAEFLPNLADFCASFQRAMLRHMGRRLQRALEFCQLQTKREFPVKSVVLSGGVASNRYLRSGLQQICNSYNCELVCPPPALCVDNGLMIAWNALEKIRRYGLDAIAMEPDDVNGDVEARSPLGRDIRWEVTGVKIKVQNLAGLDEVT